MLLKYNLPVSYLFYLLVEMFSESPLIVIDEYPIKSAKPFGNPICKNTYQALPKIYGRKGKKRYYCNIQEIIRHEHTTFHRECCHMEVQQAYRPSSDHHDKKKVNMSLNLEAMPKGTENAYGGSNKRHCICGKSLERKEGEGTGMGVHQGAVKLDSPKPQAKLQKISLPHLKDIDEVKEAESRHKVCQLTSNPAIENPRRTIQSRILLESRLEKLKELKQLRQSRIARTQSIQTDPQPSNNLQIPITAPVQSSEEKPKEKQHIFKTPNATTSRKRMHSEPNDINKPYYEYLENDPRFRHNSDKQKDNSNQPHNLRNLRRGTPSQDEALSMSSFTIKNQHSASTVFHHFKKKHSRGNSHLPLASSQKKQPQTSQLFKLPQPEDYEAFLTGYQPMNPHFDLKKLIRKKDFQIVPGEGFVYFGQVSGQKKHGEGILVLEKELFEGIFQNNARVSGCEKNREGVYTGQFQGGKRSGDGQFVWNNGEQFDGQWRDGRKNGFGKWQSPKGDSYQGEWKDNKQSGKGYFVHFGGSKYRGYFKDFLKHGKGEEEFSNGDKYVGEYQLGKPHGYGKYTWANGDIYQGDFIDGQREGKGILRKADGQIYEGEFKNDAKQGNGTEKYKSGQQFIGEFRKGERYCGTLRIKNGTEIMVTAD